MPKPSKFRKLKFRFAAWSLIFSAAGLMAMEEKNFKLFQDIVYAKIPGTDPCLTSMDVYAPKKAGSYPIVAYLHGGGLYSGDKQPIGFKAQAFTSRGFVLASLNYRLSPAVKYPAHVQDAAKAIAFLHKKAGKFSGDPEKIFLLGFSSGAHLAALLATDEKFLKAEGLPLSALKGIICLDEEGYDLPWLQELEPRLFNSVYLQAFGDEPKIWREASPLNHVAPGKAIPPFLIFHLGKPTQKQMAEKLANALRSAGVDAQLAAVSGQTHYGLDRDLGKNGDEPTRLIFEFLDKH